jgi:integrase
VWSIPAEKMKMRWPHQVPLSRQVLDLLDEIRTLTGHSPYVFPASHTWKRPMSENTVTFALRRMGYSGSEMTAHGFRAMAATLLNEMGLWNPDAIERQLAHMENKRCAPCLRPRTILGRARAHDAALVRLSRSAARRGQWRRGSP